MFLYYFYELVTAPGVVVHELAHALFCLFAGVRVHKIKLFGFGQTAGYVVHDEPQKFYQGFLISIGPLLINSLLALFCFSQFVLPYNRWQPFVFLWLGIAIGLHAIPSDQDAKALFNLANHRVKRNPLIILAYPLILILYLLYLLKHWHIDFLFLAGLYWLGNMYLKQ
ncbi:MAG: hypothetical protein UR53_C0004G0002 [Candidatus Magasanikbacteria bacterium GW2011_GWC2_34_16]|uniref:Uncharacterized protein n=2 Tax=Candidatus Magasanikiibacteriota TaxID=1752731 RepID=A0A0G0KFK9_9BACT|nr:MAG: hypothetical protein UR53_C0004G0002 [Candidatus Magasanikbacteria bacterium GW2011_GWC2_34_16]KKQ39371.1 MAG: hypothetical protein US58_C0034G0002 [Candidatus Magasanikbacteria bacterium GW2011_GWA2_37_8]